MQIDTLYGALDVPDWPDDLIVKALRLHGEWGAVETDLFSRVLPDDAVLWDCGAFLGSFTLGVSRLKALSRVLAVEANPELFAPLSSNLSRLARCPADVVSGGVAASEGFIAVIGQAAVDQNHGAQAYAYEATQPDNKIPCHTLRDLRAQYGDYTALKLDIEGMEVEAIKGDFAYIRDHKPILWVECNEDHQSLDILSAMKALGYAPLYLAFPAFRAANHHGAQDLIYPMAYEAALLAAPQGVLEAVDWHVPGEEIIVRPVKTHGDLRRALFDTPRWSRKDWLDLGRAELIARLGRGQKGQTLAGFLPAPKRT